MLIKDLKVKGAGQTLKTARSFARSASPTIPKKSIAGTTIKGLVLRTEFVCKR